MFRASIFALAVLHFFFLQASSDLTANQQSLLEVSPFQFRNAHAVNESYVFASRLSGTPRFSAFSRMLGDALLRYSDTHTNIFGVVVEQLPELNTTFVSKAGFDRIGSLIALGWLRVNNGHDIPRALSWRLHRQPPLDSSVRSSDIIYFATMPTPATKTVLRQLKKSTNGIHQIFSVSSTSYFPYGMYRLPVPFLLCARPMLRVGGMAYRHDIQIPYFSHIIPSGPRQLQDIQDLFTESGRSSLLAFVGSIERSFFNHHLTRSRHRIVHELLAAEQRFQMQGGKHDLANTAGIAELQHLFAAPLLEASVLAEYQLKSMHTEVTFADFSHMPESKLATLMAVYASSHFVLCYAGDTNLRQAIYDAWYTGAIPVVQTQLLANLQITYGGHLFPSLEDVKLVVVAFPEGTSGDDVLSHLKELVATGAAARKRADIRELVDHVVYRADTTFPDAFTWALGVIAQRAQAYRDGETVTLPTIPSDHLWTDQKECLCEQAHIPICRAQYCYEAKRVPNQDGCDSSFMLDRTGPSVASVPPLPYL